jgi:hypothetical protein
LLPLYRPERLQDNVHILYAAMHDYTALEEALATPAVAAALAQQGLPSSIAAEVVDTTRYHLQLVETALGENVSKYSAAQVGLIYCDH